MTTVETKVETFEPVVEMLLAGSLAFVSMSDFLAAYPKYAQPIPEMRLREILRAANSKKDIKRLWLIHTAYGCLAKGKALYVSLEPYIKEREVIDWKIEEIILKEVELPENDTLEGMRFLRFSVNRKTIGEALKRTNEKFRAHLDRLVDDSKNWEELYENLRLIPKEYDQRERMTRMIEHKINETIARSRSARKLFGLLDDKRVADSDSRQWQVFNRVLEVTREIDSLLELDRRASRQGVDFRTKVHLQIVAVCNNKEELWKLVEERTIHYCLPQAVEKLLTKFPIDRPSDLERAFKCSFVAESTTFVSECEKLLEETSDTEIVLKVYKWLKDISHLRNQWVPAKFKAVRRLYELQKTSQSA